MAKAKKPITANIAVVGLGRVGSVFLEKFVARKKKGLKLVAVDKNPHAPGIKIAKKYRIPVLTDIKDILAMGDDLDVIFDLTGNEETRRELREGLLNAGNQNTVIAPEVIASLLFLFDLMTGGKKLPAIHEKKGY